MALCSCTVGFALTIVKRNIFHRENGREPNAFVALLPDVIVIPLFYCLVAWATNTVVSNLGFKLVASFSAISILLRLYRLHQLSKVNLGSDVNK